ncbi:TPA: hypothetical protein ACH3X3_012215 [Trebouxia sp. C0006]
MPNVVIQHVVALESVCLMGRVPLCPSSAAQSRGAAARGAQHWAQHATVGMSTEQRNHKRRTFSWWNKGDPAGASAKRAGSRNVFGRARRTSISFRRLHRYSGAGDSAFPADFVRLPHAWHSVLSRYP